MAKKKIKLEEVKPAEVKGLLRDVPLENPVELTSVTRFSADHILRTSYNPTSKAVVLEDVPAGLKSEFILGESGGSGVSNPVLTMNIVNGTGDEMLIRAAACRMDADIGQIVYDTFTITEDATVNTLVIPFVSDGEYSYEIEVTSVLSEYGVRSASDLVNCTVDEDFESISITDPTLPASLTITYNAG